MERIDDVFRDVEKSLEKYCSVSSMKCNLLKKGEAWGAASVKVVSGLTDILKNVLSKPESEGFEKTEITKRFCEFVDMLSRRDDGTLWSFASDVNDGEVLISFLKELAADKKFVPQIDRIFRSGSYRCPLVNQLSKYYETKKKFNELFSMLPEDYQNKLLGETISYQDGDKDYAYPLIGGSALMGF